MHRTKQVHFWVSTMDYEFLLNYAEKNDMTVSVLLRLLIRQLRQTAPATDGATPLPAGQSMNPLAKRQKAS